jgi:uncharacterized DUF497 family protein
MIIEHVRWKDYIVDKIIERHAVTPDEVEEVIYDSDPEIRRFGKNRYLIWGQSCAGRYLFIVVEEESHGVFVPLTARDMTESEKRAFKKRQRPNY